MTIEEWAEWMVHPGTLEFRDALRTWKDNLKDQWEHGHFAQGKSLYLNSLADAQARGQLDILRKLIELDYEQFSQIFEDE